MLTKEAIFLLDDAHRAGELAVLERWAEDFGLHYSVHGDADRAFALARLPKTRD